VSGAPRPGSDRPIPAARYDGLDADALRRRTRATAVELLERTGSVLDVAHERAAAGAAAGLLVLAEQQTAGRGRLGRAWHSPAGAGVYLAALLRPRARPFSGAIAVRVGLALAGAVEDAAPGASPWLKWPNDLMVASRKAGGVLCEARWSGASQGWVAIGNGVNVRGPVPAELKGRAIALAEVLPGVSRAALLEALVPRIWPLAERPSALDDAEREAFQRRLWVEPGSAEEPVGVDGDGALLVRAADGKLDRRVMPA
jgi:BirA family transcriptional regulator, biotin operon repressor / biotin---[acetyl-CoA-carboxylase] ligase